MLRHVTFGEGSCWRSASVWQNLTCLKLKGLVRLVSNDLVSFSLIHSI